MTSHYRAEIPPADAQGQLAGNQHWTRQVSHHISQDMTLCKASEMYLKHVVADIAVLQ